VLRKDSSMLPDLDSLKRKMELIAEDKRRGDPEARKRLISFLSDESWHVREVAVRALRGLEGISSKELEHFLEGGLWYSRAAAAQVLGGIGSKEDVSVLSRLASEKNVMVRESAERAIQEISEREAQGERPNDAPRHSKREEEPGATGDSEEKT